MMRTMMLTLVAVAGCSSSPDMPAPMDGDPCVHSTDCYLQYDGSANTHTLTCSRFGRACRAASNLALGEACTNDVQCASRACDPNYHACTKACAADAACGSGTACAFNKYSGWNCAPTCASNDDCAVYQTTANLAKPSCKMATSRDGIAVSVCNP